MEETASFNWKRVVYLSSALQIGAGVVIMGVLSFIPLFIRDLGVTDPGEAAMWAGLISGITPLMLSISSPYWTMLADRYGVRRIMAAILTAIMLVTFGCYFVTSPLQLLILRTLQGTVGGFVPIGAALTVAVTPKEKTTWALGIFQASMVVGVMLGPLLGGMIADGFGYRMPFLVFGTLALVCLIGNLLFTPEVETHRNNSSLRENMVYFMKNPTVRLMIFLQFLCNFGMTGIGPILPLYIREMLGNNPAVATIVGFIIFLAGAMSALSSLLVNHLTARVGHAPHPDWLDVLCRRILYSAVPHAQRLGTGTVPRPDRFVHGPGYAGGQHGYCHVCPVG
jgi:MFS transporter, DHA1 family, multidrug resistance protein